MCTLNDKVTLTAMLSLASVYESIGLKEDSENLTSEVHFEAQHLGYSDGINKNDYIAPILFEEHKAQIETIYSDGYSMAEESLEMRACEYCQDSNIPMCPVHDH